MPPLSTDETPVDVLPAEVPILDAEPDVGSGVAGALRLAISKGYLEKEDKNKPSASRFAHLQAQNYSIEDKTYFDDDKFGRRERYSGPTSDFKEKETFKPNVKLEYIDDDGRILNAKEAFRYLSHKFHGKGPGKNKVEKRMKKNEQEGLMKQMSSTDTPLGTLNLLQAKQKETQSAFVVLSGSKQTEILLACRVGRAVPCNDRTQPYPVLIVLFQDFHLQDKALRLACSVVLAELQCCRHLVPFSCVTIWPPRPSTI
uniref:U4/U6.U5 tri-snRNP-associated protein 1 n=1 Tax=Timema bartmani TaxID=61472 RepID=A0A7R9I0Z9_9NEOP|nr:unnamed protein product [Timema bartmani]